MVLYQCVALFRNRRHNFAMDTQIYPHKDAPIHLIVTMLKDTSTAATKQTVTDETAPIMNWLLSNLAFNIRSLGSLRSAKEVRNVAIMMITEQMVPTTDVITVTEF